MNAKTFYGRQPGHPSRFLRQVVSTSLPDNGNVSDAADASDGSTWAALTSMIGWSATTATTASLNAGRLDYSFTFLTFQLSMHTYYIDTCLLYTSDAADE